MADIKDFQDSGSDTAAWVRKQRQDATRLVNSIRVKPKKHNYKREMRLGLHDKIHYTVRPS